MEFHIHTLKLLKMLSLQRSYRKCKNIRLYANVAIKDRETNCPAINNTIETTSINNSELIGHAKHFNQIPGPTGLFGVGTFYHYLPAIGKYSWSAIHKSGFDKQRKYGDIVKERVIPGVDIVWLFDPNDIAKAVTNTGPGAHPQRRSHLGMAKYRIDRPHIYKTAGLIAT